MENSLYSMEVNIFQQRGKERVEKTRLFNKSSFSVSFIQHATYLVHFHARSYYHSPFYDSQNYSYFVQQAESSFEVVEVVVVVAVVVGVAEVSVVRFVDDLFRLFVVVVVDDLSVQYLQLYWG